MYNTYRIHVIISAYLTNTYTHNSNDIVYMCIIMHVQIPLKTHTYYMYVHVHYILYVCTLHSIHVYNYARTNTIKNTYILYVCTCTLHCIHTCV